MVLRAVIKVKNQLNVDAVNRDGWSAVFFASINGWASITKYLINERNASMDIEDTWKRTPLHWVGRFNNEIMFKELLELGYNANFKDCEGQSVLDLCKTYDCQEV